MATEITAETGFGSKLDRPDGESSAQSTTGKEAYYVASQWTLMWWKLRKHKLAIVAGPILIVLYLCALSADFLSFTLPETR